MWGRGGGRAPCRRSPLNDRRPAEAGRPAFSGAGERLQRGDVDCLGALVPGLGVVADARAFGERLEALGVDAGVVDEEVLAGIVRRDEAEALVVVEPLDGSGGHVWVPPGISVLRSQRVLRRQRLGTLAQLASGWFPTVDDVRIPFVAVGAQCGERSGRAGCEASGAPGAGDPATGQALAGCGSGRTTTVSATAMTSSTGRPAREACSRMASGLEAS